MQLKMITTIIVYMITATILAGIAHAATYQNFTIFYSGFESGITDGGLWTTEGTGAGSWAATQDQKQEGTYSAKLGNNTATVAGKNLTSSAIYTTNCSVVWIIIHTRDDDIDDADEVWFRLQDNLGNWDNTGTELGLLTEDSWWKQNISTTDSQYKHSALKLNFWNTGALANTENLWVDNVSVICEADIDTPPPCDTSCLISQTNYTVNLTEGTIYTWRDSDNEEWGQTQDKQAGIGDLYSGTWLTRPDNTTTKCDNQTGLDASIVYINCSNGIAKANWTFFPTYINLQAMVTSAYRVSNYIVHDNDPNYYPSNQDNGSVRWTKQSFGYTYQVINSSYFVSGVNRTMSNGKIFAMFWNTTDNYAINNSDVSLVNNSAQNETAVSIGRTVAIPANRWISINYKILIDYADGNMYPELLAFRADPTYQDITAADSCTYDAGDWTIDCSDACNLNTNTDVGGNNIYFSGSGTVTISAIISGAVRTMAYGGCRVVTMSGGKITK